ERRLAARQGVVRRREGEGGRDEGAARPDARRRGRDRAGVSRTQYYTATTLDGFIADQDNSLEWLFTRQQDEGGPLNYKDFIAEVGVLAMGSTTYEWILDHHEWPYEVPSWVFSHRELPVVPDARIEFVSGDVVPVHEAMVSAAGGKNVWIVGGGDLAG